MIESIARCARPTAVALTLFVAAPAQIANGDMNGSAAYNSFNGVIPAAWIPVFGSADLFDATTTFAGFAWQPSAGGGPFVHAVGGTFIESIRQIVPGLVPGVGYSICFEQAIAHPTWATADGYWQVTFGNQAFDSATMTIPLPAQSTSWQPQAIDFTPTAAVQALTFEAHGQGGRADLGLDTVSLKCTGTGPITGPDVIHPPTTATWSHLPCANSMAIVFIGMPMSPTVMQGAPFCAPGACFDCNPMMVLPPTALGSTASWSLSLPPCVGTYTFCMQWACLTGGCFTTTASKQFTISC
ncbi:MAG: hypothetical protein KDC98_04790 [Planctomycetes bacterium]|nr:hypothetical protein [Planctomycetota bacterium]